MEDTLGLVGCKFLCPYYPIMPNENSHRWYVNEWVWLCSNKTLFTKIGGGHILSMGCHVLTVLENLRSWPLSCHTWESVEGEQRDGWAFSTVSSNSPMCRQPVGIGQDHEVNSPGTDGGRQALTFQRCPLASWRESPLGPSLDSPRCYYCKCRLKGRRWSWHCRLEAPSGGLWVRTQWSTHASVRNSLGFCDP